jgi:N-acetylglucosamine-6-sulfatase
VLSSFVPTVGVTLASTILVAACTASTADQGDPDSRPASTATGVPISPSLVVSAPPPNIVLILTDDQAVADWAGMPRTRRRLERMGATFSQALSTYPLCCPARATLLTGQYPHNHGVLGNELPWGDATLLNEKETLPVWLRRSGYQTGHIGKYLHGYPTEGDRLRVPDGWDRWVVPIDGANRYYEYTLNEHGVAKEHTQYQTEFIRDRTVEMIDEFTADEKPFFLWSNFLAPHAGLPREPDDPRTLHGEDAVDTPAVHPRYQDAFAGRRVPRSSALNEADMSDQSRFLRRRSKLPLAQVDEVYQQRLESLRSVDDAVMDILDVLDRSGELSNTLFVFASDNGFSLGQHRWLHKVVGYEESIRVPLVMAGPGITPNVRRDQLVSLTDLTATFLDAADTQPSLPMDGISLLPVSQDKEFARDRALLLESGGWPFPAVGRLYVGVRTADGKVLLRWWNRHQEAYDLADDPHQLDGTISPAEEEWVGELRDGLASLVDCVGEACSAFQYPAGKG